MILRKCMTQTRQDKAFQLAGLALTNQGGHSTEHWSEGQLTGSLPRTGIPCHRSVLLARLPCAVTQCWGLWEWPGIRSCVLSAL